MGHSYERVTYRTDDARRRTTILRNPRVVPFAGSEALTGVEVDREGTEVAPRGVDERRHIITLALVTKRTRLTWNLKYAELEAAE